MLINWEIIYDKINQYKYLIFLLLIDEKYFRGCNQCPFCFLSDLHTIIANEFSRTKLVLLALILELLNFLS